MRTTLDIDDDVLAAARELARSEKRSIGAVLSDLARRGLRPERPQDGARRRFPTFPVSPDSPPITLEDVKRALDDEWYRCASVGAGQRNDAVLVTLDQAIPDLLDRSDRGLVRVLSTR